MLNGPTLAGGRLGRVDYLRKLRMRRQSASSGWKKADLHLNVALLQPSLEVNEIV